MLNLSIVRKIGEGNYLNDDSFILERVRKERALNLRRMKSRGDKRKARSLAVNAKFTSS